MRDNVLSLLKLKLKLNLIVQYIYKYLPTNPVPYAT